jgi:outer membrane protein TolC
MDQHDAQIDLVGQLGSRALEDKAGRAFSQGFSLTDRFVSVSVELSDTINGGATHAGIRQAELARQQVKLEKVQARENIATQLSTLLNQLSYGTKTLKAAERRVAAETKKFNAEMERYREGRSNTAIIVQFEGELRMAELQTALQRTSLQMASQQLRLTEGTLLSQLGALSTTEPETGDNP